MLRIHTTSAITAALLLATLGRGTPDDSQETDENNEVIEREDEENL